MTGDELLAIRRRGKRPDTPVLISMVGEFQYFGWPVIAVGREPERMEARGLIDLDVRIVHAQQWPRLYATIDHVLKARVDELTVCDVLTNRCVLVVAGGERWFKACPPWEFEDWKGIIARAAA